MAGSVLGDIFKITTWGESHGEGIGVVIDGCPAGIELSNEDIQKYLERRRPGKTKYSTPRNEPDEVSILSGVFEGKTTGSPISLVVYNTSQRSKDYSNIAKSFRPGHGDFTYFEKYNDFYDYRGGGRSSGRETIGRVAAGAVAAKILKELGIEIISYAKEIAGFECDEAVLANVTMEDVAKSPLAMPDLEQSVQAEEYLSKQMENGNSAGGIIECVVKNCKVGLGDPVFDKMDALLAKAIMSIGSVKGIEIGAGFKAARMSGTDNNDEFYMDGEKVAKKTNNAGGILAGITDGSDIVVRAAIKPTPSIFSEQKTVNKDMEDISLVIEGRHDPIIVPRAVVVVEAMTAITIVDRLFVGMSSRMDRVKKFYLSED